MLDHSDPTLRAMMMKAKELGAKPQFFVEELPDGTKVVYITVVAAKLADQVYNTINAIVGQNLQVGLKGLLTELEARGVIPPAPPFVDEEKKG